MTEASALYIGEVTHRRLRPREHRLRYRVFWMLLDLDQIDDIDRKLKLFSRNRFNLLSFHDRDHGLGDGSALRDRIEDLVSRAGVEIAGGAVRLMTMPRVLGFVFNPISLYYCSGPDGVLKAMVYEVTSTFGVRHAYVIPLSAEDARRGLIRQGAAKALYVSPFMGMDMDYAFRGHAPGECMDMTVDGLDDEGLLITAQMRGGRRDLSDAQVLRTALAFPFLTLKVVAAIHWEALKLWIKGVRLTRQPPPAAEPVSIQRGPVEARTGSSRTDRAA
ncbi:DUF1365 domain-containing protein [Brevundimonas sp. VNH65]|uniref:DUF1365 domain-containing protein n=1 Tax=Brevundimonas sp. VNH65 TaxID=3400917 RepID=UPI003C1191D5